MAFSTQKDFFQVPFINEFYEVDCPKVCVSLKTYPSTVDGWYWSSNEVKKSRLVADLVACNQPVVKNLVNEAAIMSLQKKRNSAFDEYGSDLLLDDSLINAADYTIERMRQLMIQNNILHNQVPGSQVDKILTAKEECEEIKRIMTERYNPENSNALKIKIKDLANTNIIKAQDEKELNEMLKCIDDMNKAQKILEAENAYLKRIIEKQSARCRLDSIEIDPERSQDTQYLQKKIDDLGKEVSLLRQTEDMLIKKCAKMCRGESSEESGGAPIFQNNVFSLEQDISNIQRILAERDALRKKCKNLQALGEKVIALEQNAIEAGHLSGDLEDNINQQNQYINDMQQDMQNMQNYYENEMDKARGTEEVLKCRCNQMMQELSSAKFAAQKCECQQMEIDELRSELHKRDNALSEYDCQYHQLMIVICELNQRYRNQQNDCPAIDPKSCSPDFGHDLAFYTRATLDHIMNELCKQSDCFKMNNQKKYSTDSAITSLDECTKELGRLRDFQNVNKVIYEAVENEKPDAKDSLTNCQQELTRLRNILKKKDGQLGLLIEENDCLCEAAELNKKKLDDLDYQVQRLDEDTRFMEQGIVESIGLIQDIGDVAQENEWLKGQVSNLMDSEARKLFDDLSQQLEDCMEQSSLLNKINKALGETLQGLGVDPHEIETKVKELHDKDMEEKAKGPGTKGALKNIEPLSGQKTLFEPEVGEFQELGTIAPQVAGTGPNDTGFDTDHGIGEFQGPGTFAPELTRHGAKDAGFDNAQSTGVLKEPVTTASDVARKGPKEAGVDTDQSTGELLESGKFASKDADPAQGPASSAVPGSGLEAKPAPGYGIVQEPVTGTAAEQKHEALETEVGNKGGTAATQKPGANEFGKNAQGKVDAVRGIESSAENGGAGQGDTKSVPAAGSEAAQITGLGQEKGAVSSQPVKTEVKPGNETKKDTALGSEKGGETDAGKVPVSGAEQRTGSKSAPPATSGQVAASNPISSAGSAQAPSASSAQAPSASSAQAPSTSSAQPAVTKPAPSATSPQGADPNIVPSANSAPSAKSAPPANSAQAAATKSEPSAISTQGAVSNLAPSANSAQAVIPKAVPSESSAQPATQRGEPGKPGTRNEGEGNAGQKGESSAKELSEPISQQKGRPGGIQGTGPGNIQGVGPSSVGVTQPGAGLGTGPITPSSGKENIPKTGQDSIPGTKKGPTAGVGPSATSGSAPGPGISNLKASRGGENGQTQKIGKGVSDQQNRPYRLGGSLSENVPGKRSNKRTEGISDAFISGSLSSSRPSQGSSLVDKFGKKTKKEKGHSARCRDDGQFDEFVRHTVQSLSAGGIDGCGLERELRNILDMFVDECGFCFCKCNIPKSRFYAICHKLYHHGLHTLDFKELAYMHRRIYAAAENILPGCLFNMIVKDMTRASCAANYISPYFSGSLHDEYLPKCCSCKSTMCCDANEEKLMQKVIRLETDIENAKMCLKNLKSIPSRLSIPMCRLNGGDFSVKELGGRPKYNTKALA